MKTGAIRALDVSYCGLDDTSLRHMIVSPLLSVPSSLRFLSISSNPGRLPAHALPGMLQHLTNVRELDLSGSIQADGCIDGPLLPFACLESMQMLEGLDISGYKVSTASYFRALATNGLLGRQLDSAGPGAIP